MFHRFLTTLTALELGSLTAYGLVAALWNVPPASVLLIPLIFWTARLLTGRPIFARSPADLAIGLLVILTGISLIFVSSAGPSQIQASRLVFGILLYYAIMGWTRQQNHLRWLTGGLVAAAVALSIFAVISVEWDTTRFLFLPTHIYEYFAILVSDSVHRNVMAGALLQVGPLVLVLALATWRRKQALPALGLLAVGLFVATVLILTQSRSAVLAYGAVVLLLLVLARSSSLSRALLQVLVPLLVVFGLILLLSPSVADYLYLGGLDRRLAMWSRGIYMISDFPWTGVGIGMYESTLNSFYPLFEINPEVTPHAHNVFIQIGVDLGLPGLIAWLAAYFIVLNTAWQLYLHGRRGKSIYGWALGLGLFAGQIGLGLHGISDAVAWGMVRSAPLVWVLWASVMGAHRVTAADQDNQKNASDHPS